MPRIFEIFGYHIEDTSEKAERSRRSAWCPFMDSQCDGGGNRPQSNIRLRDKPELRQFFDNPGEEIPSGVCSLQLRPHERPWIVCPRRLLVLGRRDMGQRRHQSFAEKLLLRHAGFEPGTTLGVWPEVKMKYIDEASGKSFDYTFDYILMPVGRSRQDEIEQRTGGRWRTLRPLIEKAGYGLAYREGACYVEDFPLGFPCVIEIMTSSTSGGNKRKRTTIPMAFEDAVLGRSHQGPGINYRQVWARMVSQFIVKSEVGIGWGGKTFWILQDTLVDYITGSTALDFRRFLSEHTSEVNVLSFSYGDAYENPSGVIELEEGVLYSGPISARRVDPDAPSFQDMIRAPVRPPVSALLMLLTKRSPTNKILVGPLQ